MTNENNQWNYNIREGSVSVIVAAYDADPLVKNRADYVCDGVDDEVQIQEAIDSLPDVALYDAGLGGGSVCLSQGTFNISDSVYLKNSLMLIGTGPWSTHIHYVGDDPDKSAITVESGAGTLFFCTMRGLGLWGNKDRYVLMDGSGSTGCGIDLSPGGGDSTADSRIYDCWAAWWPACGFKGGTWNQQIIGCTAEYCFGYGVRGFSEIVGCHLKYNNIGALIDSGGKITECMLHKNYSGGVVTGSAGKCLIANNHLNSNGGPVIGEFSNSTDDVLLSFDNTLLTSAWKITGLSADNSDTTRFSAINILYYKMVDDGGSNWHLEFYKTAGIIDPSGVPQPPVFTDLVAHTASFGAGDTTEALVPDDGSGLGGDIDVVEPAGGYSAIDLGIFGIPNGTDFFAGKTINILGPYARVVNNRLSMDDLEGTGGESCHEYAIYSNGENCVISGNVINGNTPTTYGIRLAQKQNIVTDNSIEMVLTTSATGIRYNAAACTNVIVKNNIMFGSAASLTTGLNWGANTDWSADNIWLHP
jgi:hypothetical protein